jgi:hypothetical protein
MSAAVHETIAVTLTDVVARAGRLGRRRDTATAIVNMTMNAASRICCLSPRPAGSSADRGRYDRRG